MTTVALAKYHGLGNDFLVALDPPERDWPELARRWCARRTGIGADGMLLGSIDGAGEGGRATVRMALFNADGSRAEISGNGIRCLAHAVVRTGRVAGADVHIVTDVGERIVGVRPSADPSVVSATVSMGEARPIHAPAAWSTLGCDPLRPVAHLSVGNPHSVVLTDDVFSVDLAELGALVPMVNLEIVEPGPEPDAIRMRVHERGAGITAACGSGACAAAVAARTWGIVTTDVVTVHMDGGDALVRVREDDVILAGPSVHIADLEVMA
jgi:diaminopimelate epimerase